MKKTIIPISIRFTSPLLGSANANPEVHAEFIAHRAANDQASPKSDPARAGLDSAKIIEETQAVAEATTEEAIQKATTIFPKDDTGLFYWDYQARGFVKEVIGLMVELSDATVKDLSKWQYKRAVDGLVFVNPRKIYLRDEQDKIITQCTQTLQRPLRAETMQGDRVALASSQILPPGTQMHLFVSVIQGNNPKSKLARITPETIIAVFDYGCLKGFGQWRSGGHGQFDYTITGKTRVIESDRFTPQFLSATE